MCYRVKEGSHICFEVSRCRIIFYIFYILYFVDRASRRFLLTGTSDSQPLECVIPDDVLIQAGPPDDEDLLLETCRGMK
jgi:hypothetical protein